MTFDEAVKEIHELSKRGTKVWYGPQLDKHDDVKGLLEAGEVVVIINKLRRRYGHDK